MEDTQSQLLETLMAATGAQFELLSSNSYPAMSLSFLWVILKALKIKLKKSREICKRKVQTLQSFLDRFYINVFSSVTVFAAYCGAVAEIRTIFRPSKPEHRAS